LTPIYTFAGSDGATPNGGVIQDASGALYGTTAAGGAFNGGVAFKLTPSATASPTALSHWNEEVLHEFDTYRGGPLDTLIFDSTGSLYGTTYGGGTYGGGTVFKLTPSEQGWAETVLYNFTGSEDGRGPVAGVVFDAAGNLFGTTVRGGPYSECGTVFQLTPGTSGWTETVLYNFTGLGDGCLPYAGVVVGSSGHLYGALAATDYSGCRGGACPGVIFELPRRSDGLWYTFAPGGRGGCRDADGSGPQDVLTMDASGALYGTTAGEGAHGFGNVFKLTPSSDGWTYSSLYDFTGGVDGYEACSRVTFDRAGNLYGTASYGGAYGYGVVWKIAP